MSVKQLIPLSDAKQLVNCILTNEFLISLNFWKKLLTPINKVQKQLKNKKMNFYNAALDIKSLSSQFHDARENLVNECLEDGKNLCEKWDDEIKKRQGKQKWLVKMHDMQGYQQEMK